VTIARDNVGRIHYESSRSAGNVTVMISDPIQHLNYQYEIDPSDPNNQTATSCTQPTMAQITEPNPAPASPTISASAAAPVSPPALPTSSKKDLGSQQMEGTIGYGQARIDYLDLQPGTLTMAATSWFSPDLGLNLTQLSDYSNQNPFSIHTRNVVLGDPDPSLFQLPSGYTLTGSTTSCIPTIN
jgi:hypothetical protein